MHGTHARFDAEGIQVSVPSLYLLILAWRPFGAKFGILRLTLYVDIQSLTDFYLIKSYFLPCVLIASLVRAVHSVNFLNFFKNVNTSQFSNSFIHRAQNKVILMKNHLNIGSAQMLFLHKYQ